MSIDSERRTIIRLRNELAKLKQDYAKEQEKIASLQKKNVAAQTAIKRTKHTSTINSKLNEIGRNNKLLAEASKKCGDLQKKAGKKEHDLTIAEKRLSEAESKESEKRQTEAEKQMRTMSEELHTQALRQDVLDEEIQSLKTIPQEITILFLAANPTNTCRLRLDEEVRSIQEKIRLSEYRDIINFETRWAVRTDDIFQAINETKPTIIHFSGHGCNTGELVLQNSDGLAKFISPNAIAKAIATVSNTVRLVFFNACHSTIQAQNVVDYIDIAIGMSDSILDDAACIFAARFYSSIGFGLSVKQAFKQAIAELILEGIPQEQIPQLFEHVGVDSSEVYLVSE